PSGSEQRMKGATDRELADFKREAFRNAVRLYRDACLLLAGGRCPTAYGVGVLAFEARGKGNAIDWACGVLSQDPASREQIFDDLIAGRLLSDHRFKQRR